MAVAGYYRHPTIHGDVVAFVSEDDLWSVPASGGTATRLTANPGLQTRPRFSPDGSQLAFVSRDEGRLDVHVMDSDGGPVRRISHLGASTNVVGWRPDGESVVVATDHRSPFAGWLHLWDVSVDGSGAAPFGIGPAYAISFQPGGEGIVIARNAFDPARWKRYRGGRAGSLWIDRDGDGTFVELVSLDGNLADPMWIGRRIYFLSDHEGVGNLYSVTPTGRGLRRHTHHEEFYARFPSTDGRRIVYHCGADLWTLDPAGDEPIRMDVRVPSARPQLNRRFQDPGRFLETIDLHPEGHSLAVTARGAAYSMALWEGPAVRHGEPSRHRRRLVSWMPDGERLVAVTDEHGEEVIEVRRADAGDEPRFVETDLGRIRSLDVAPAGPDRLAVTNHRHEVAIVNLETGSAETIHRSPHSWIRSAVWSPDGRWLGFASRTTRTTMNVFLYDTEKAELHRIGEPEHVDHSLCFDPGGSFLYFLTSRIFDPVPDSVFHDYGFPRSTIPMVVPLSATDPSPFDPAMKAPRAPGSAPGASKSEGKDDDGGTPEVQIDVQGLAGRARAFPVPPARYEAIATGRGRVFLYSRPVAGPPGSDVPRGRLEAWDTASEKLETVAEGVSGFTTSLDGSTLAIRFGNRVRVVPVAWKDDKSGKDEPSRETGWIDCSRVRVEVVPQDEWRQMFGEAWRLQRDHFWWDEMAGVDWLAIHDRYLSLVGRVASRAEFSDLLWEMQGELGTSHAYELGGDYRPEPAWTQGMLGADVSWRRGAWRIDRIPEGDPWVAEARSPLAAPGLGIEAGDRILAVGGRPLDGSTTPESRLVDRAGRPVTITVARGRRRPRTVSITPLASETALRYRDWVSSNRRLVRELSDGRAGYIHIPDMGVPGFAEFHRSWRSEVDHDGLVIDVRFNRGGNVSHLLLQKLLRRRLGYRITRWREPQVFPSDAPMGPMVAVTNEMAGSDGDIFSHAFKLHGLGPLVGTRTWGGVVGIWPQQSLVDGTVTTQPEFATWFTDVGFDVENYGTDPDVEVVNAPQDYAADRDPQLERSVELLLDRIAAAEPLHPDVGPRPPVRAPRLSG